MGISRWQWFLSFARIDFPRFLCLNLLLALRQRKRGSTSRESFLLIFGFPQIYFFIHSFFGSPSVHSFLLDLFLHSFAKGFDPLVLFSHSFLPSSFLSSVSVNSTHVLAERSPRKELSWASAALDLNLSFNFRLYFVLYPVF